MVLPPNFKVAKTEFSPAAIESTDTILSEDDPVQTLEAIASKRQSKDIWSKSSQPSHNPPPESISPTSVVDNDAPPLEESAEEALKRQPKNASKSSQPPHTLSPESISPTSVEDNDAPPLEDSAEEASKRQSKDAPSEFSQPSHTLPPESISPTSVVDNDASPLEETAEEASQQGAFNEDTGEINWECPCLGGMAHGPCGDEFRAAFSCFVFSKEEPKGIECIDNFKYVFHLPKAFVSAQRISPYKPTLIYQPFLF